MGVDPFLAMMPDHADKDARQWIRPFSSAYFHSVAAFVRAGFPAIVDTVFEHRDFVEDYKAATEGIKTTYVGLFCPTEILEERERRRGDRRIGMAKIQNEVVHNHVTYDLRLDTDKKAPKACVQEIIEYLENNPQEKRG